MRDKSPSTPNKNPTPLSTPKKPNRGYPATPPQTPDRHYQEGPEIDNDLSSSFQSKLNIHNEEENLTNAVKNINTAKARRKAKKKFELNYDDSSDEEDTEKVKNYEIDKKLKEFSPSLNYKFLTDHELSFITHALGLKVFYSESVQKAYYNLKKQYLKHDFRKSDLEIRELYKFTLEFNIEFLIVGYQKSPKNDHLIDKFFCKDNFYAFDKYLEIRSLLFLANRQIFKIVSSNEKKLKEEFSKENLELFKSINVILGDLYEESEKYKKSNNYKLHNIEETDFLTKFSKNYPDLFEKLKEEVEERSNKIFEETTKNKDAKDKICLTNSTKKAKIKKIACNVDVQDIEVYNEYDDFKKHLLNSLKTHAKKSKDNLTVPVFLQNLNLYLKLGYILFKENNVNISLKKFIENFYNNLEKNIRNKFFKSEFSERKTLPNHFVGERISQESALIDFLAHLRLYNRSIKRTIRNHDYFKPLFPNQVFSYNFKFKIPEDYTAITTQEITSEGNRMDKVSNMTSYPEIYKTINLIIKEYELSEKYIAESIRNILNGKNLDIINDGDKPLSKPKMNEIKKFITDLTYLLFGCEVMRNPACLIHHQMILDLIIEKRMSFKALFVGTAMPMQIEGAVNYARTNQTTYNNHMPIDYVYPKKGNGVKITKENYTNFTKREAKLTKIWANKPEKSESESKFRSIRTGMKNWYSWLNKPEQNSDRSRS